MKTSTYNFLGVSALLLLGMPFWLGGCRRRTPEPEPTPVPTPTATPAPTRTPNLDLDADQVNRHTTDNITFDYRVMLNGTPLMFRQSQVAAYEFFDARAIPAIYYPLRAVGEGLGYKVSWQARKRRVLWNNSVVPQGITLLNGRSYLSSTRFADWLGQFKGVSKVTPFRFGDTTGYVEIESESLKAAKSK